MAEPVSGCPGGHSFCKSCFRKSLLRQNRCPQCRGPVHGLVPNRCAETMIANMRMRCVLAPEEQLAAQDGTMPEQAVGCAWRGCVGELAAHLRSECEIHNARMRCVHAPRQMAWWRHHGTMAEETAGCAWIGRHWERAAHLEECGMVPERCPNGGPGGCQEMHLRKDLAEHMVSTCDFRLVCCKHCGMQSLFVVCDHHEDSCPDEKIECPNEGCSVLWKRGSMRRHRAKCEHEEVTCPSKGCTARLLRKDMDAHVAAKNLGAAFSTVKLMERIAALEETASSEQRHSAPESGTWVFNWKADAYGPGSWISESHDFGIGFVGVGTMNRSSMDLEFVVGFKFLGREDCSVHAEFSILDKHDKPLLLREPTYDLSRFTSSPESRESDPEHFAICSQGFHPQEWEHAQAVRADGSVRLRAVVRLFDVVA